MSAHPTAVLSGVHDVMAAELLAAAAETNAGAREMTRELNDLLTTAYIHNRRAERLNDAAIQVTMFGAHDVAALIGRFAAEEMEAAEEFEAVGASCIRGMHSFGYMSEAEQRFIRRKKFEEAISTKFGPEYARTTEAFVFGLRPVYEQVFAPGSAAERFLDRYQAALTLTPFRTCAATAVGVLQQGLLSVDTLLGCRQQIKMLLHVRG